MLCSGCSCALDLCIMALCSPGSTLLAPRPGFPLYQTLAQGLGVNVKYYDLIVSTSCVQVAPGATRWACICLGLYNARPDHVSKSVGIPGCLCNLSFCPGMNEIISVFMVNCRHFSDFINVYIITSSLLLGSFRNYHLNGLIFII